jgi:hypothetical protein
MVNSKLKYAAEAAPPRYGTARNRGKSGISTVNEFLSKRFKFADNSRFIRFE